MLSPTTVFLPGASGKADFWRPIAQELAGRGPQKLLGWPGFGEEPADPSVRSLRDLAGWTLRQMPPDPANVVAQSMGGVIAAQIAIENPKRIARLVLVATSGGVDVKKLGGADWRPDFTRENGQLPKWFVDDRTDLTDQLEKIQIPVLLIWGDSDPISPVAVGEFLRSKLPSACLAVVPGGGHDLARTHADETARLIAGHLFADS
ncbi:MAG: alpha/beta hydrolase [Bdellovibrionota bacterium]